MKLHRWQTWVLLLLLAVFASGGTFNCSYNDNDKHAYLEVVPNGKDAIYAVDREGQPAATHTYWKGFKRGTTVGLILEHASPQRCVTARRGRVLLRSIHEAPGGSDPRDRCRSNTERSNPHRGAPRREAGAIEHD